MFRTFTEKTGKVYDEERAGATRIRMQDDSAQHVVLMDVIP